MTISITRGSPYHEWGPVVAFANWFDFAPEQQVRQPCVKSRMLLWCTSGSGRLNVNGEWLEMLPDDWVLLPWGRKMMYDASKRDPFSVGAIHIIPAHCPRTPVIFEVAHDITSPLFDSTMRRDRKWAGLEGIKRGSMAESKTLQLLSTYIVERFHLGRPQALMMRPLAELLKLEIEMSTHSPLQRLPTSIRHMTEYCQDHLHEKLSVSVLARSQHCGEATIHRQFKRFLNLTPASWIAKTRVQEAARLLRSSDLPVWRIGEKIGIQDQFQFSRFFKRHHGISPRLYRNNNRWV